MTDQKRRVVALTVEQFGGFREALVSGGIFSKGGLKNNKLVLKVEFGPFDQRILKVKDELDASGSYIPLLHVMIYPPEGSDLTVSDFFAQNGEDFVRISLKSFNSKWRGQLIGKIVFSVHLPL